MKQIVVRERLADPNALFFDLGKSKQAEPDARGPAQPGPVREPDPGVPWSGPSTRVSLVGG